MGDWLDIAKEGVRLDHSIDNESIVYLGVAIFLAITLALLIYGKIFK